MLSACSARLLEKNGVVRCSAGGGDYGRGSWLPPIITAFFSLKIEKYKAQRWFIIFVGIRGKSNIIWWNMLFTYFDIPFHWQQCDFVLNKLWSLTNHANMVRGRGDRYVRDRCLCKSGDWRVRPIPAGAILTIILCIMYFTIPSRNCVKRHHYYNGIGGLISSWNSSLPHQTVMPHRAGCSFVLKYYLSKIQCYYKPVETNCLLWCRLI